ncbi:MAG TPA: hypothetical protein VHR72_07925 [Gemmataceae bacterium]|jgi:hypothetical protein|nr:hypothetical protein [Gemmataceae bacterium]
MTNTASYRRPLVWAFVIQLLLVATCGAMLDMGQHAKACAGASVAFWLGVLFIFIRRGERPTRGDLAYIRWGLFPIGILGTEAIILAWRIRGLL